ncbi:MAG TPA: hypothetical protein VKV15_06720 [Bryobacteraceae bacterium]|nr:hypothetical protein [Bryobacteraceae bacterium]
MRRKFVLLLFVTLAIAALSSVIVLVRAQAPTHVPFTAHIMYTLFKYPSGELGRSFDETVAIRPDGSSVKVHQRTDKMGQTYTIRGVRDLSAKRDFTADELTRSITSAPLLPALAASAAQKLSACKVDVPGASSQILGYKVLQSTSPTSTRIGGEILYDISWVAPDLDCFALKVVTYRQLPGKPLMAATVKRVRSVVPGEPDPSLFAAPAGYIERPPSEVMRMSSEMLGKAPPPLSTSTRLDGIYSSRNSRSGSQ